MTNTYRALTPAAEAAYAPGVFDFDFESPAAESDAVAAGLIEIAPRAYKVLSNNFAAGKQGAVIEAAFLMENEAALIAGGHIERATDTETSGDAASPEKPAAVRRTNEKG